MTVGGIPSSLPSPEYINVATDSTSFHKKPSHSENLNQSRISKEFIATGLDKDRTASFEPKHNPEYHNLVFEEGKIPSETQLHSNSSAELKSNKGNLKYICVIKRKLFLKIIKRATYFAVCDLIKSEIFQLQCQSQELKFHQVQLLMLKQYLAH